MEMLFLLSDHQPSEGRSTSGKIQASKAFWPALAIVLLLFGKGMAQEPVRGLWLARYWCASCHRVEARGAASDPAPAFAMIGRDPTTTLEKLHGWLAKPHPPMPDLKLTRVEEDDILAYVLSLKSK